ncbi:MotA/TolQ/ExbB proton channel family protein [bacterium]|nr:MotA/TolQ/ExbB proton channel family protein [bacterium]
MVYYFNKGGFLMWPLLFLFIIGIIIAIVKLWLLYRARINSKKFLNKILDIINEKGVKSAIELCEKTRGPIAALFHAGLARVDRGLEYANNSVENEAVIQMGILEKGMIWISTIISIAPMLGFLGTVQGMILAFEQIARSNDIVPSEVAGGISVSLLTTFFGLAIAIPLQFFYNWFVAIIDGMVVDMEDSANQLFENLIDKGILKKAEQ